MKNMNLRGFFSAICMASVLAGFTGLSAGPVRFDQVVQVVNARPGKAAASTYSQLRLTGEYTAFLGDENGKIKPGPTPPPDDRVITETKTEIVTDDVCDCEEAVVAKRGFPYWILLGLAAIPIAYIAFDDDDETPTPTGTQTPPTTPTPDITPTPSVTPTPEITPTPSVTPTPDPSPTPKITPTPSTTPTPDPSPTPKITPTPTKSPTPAKSPTPSKTPTPIKTPPSETADPRKVRTTNPPEPVPEPMTILLFGTGLASIGMAARRKFGKKGKGDDEKEEK